MVKDSLKRIFRITKRHRPYRETHILLLCEHHAVRSIQDKKHKEETHMRKIKKSYVYKYALSAVIEKLCNEHQTSGFTEDEVYELISSICEKIDIEMLNERREAGEFAFDDKSAEPL